MQTTAARLARGFRRERISGVRGQSVCIETCAGRHRAWVVLVAAQRPPRAYVTGLLTKNRGSRPTAAGLACRCRTRTGRRAAVSGGSRPQRASGGGCAPDRAGATASTWCSIITENSDVVRVRFLARRVEKRQQHAEARNGRSPCQCILDGFSRRRSAGNKRRIGPATAEFDTSSKFLRYRRE